jgi:glycosyltransferase involved in cell wall biosynthesis
MRILHLADRLTARGGAYTWMLGVVKGLIEEGHHVRLAVGAFEGGVAAPCEVDVRAGLGSRTEAPVELDDLVSSFDPDIVHVHNVVNPLALEWAAEHPRAALTIQDHRVFCPTRGKWTLSGEVCHQVMAPAACGGCFDNKTYFREILALTERRLAAVRRMPAVTVLSRYMREELVRVGVSPRRVRVVPPFVEGFDHEATPEGEPCVLFVGRLVAAKGVLEAVEAWKRSGVSLPLAMAGTGPLRRELESRASELEAPIEVLGWLDQQRLSAQYRRARVLVLPSRWQEPFGISGIEALSFGVPVAAWESGGVAEWHPGPGLVPWGDMDALARAIADGVTRRVAVPPSYRRDEALGRLMVLYARLNA